MLEVATAADIIAQLELRPHPEGGHYRETFRDQRVDASGRAASTAIYFLLARGEAIKHAHFTLALRRQTISFAAIKPPPAISTAAIAIAPLGLAKPAIIRNAVESSGVA